MLRDTMVTFFSLLLGFHTNWQTLMNAACPASARTANVSTQKDPTPVNATPALPGLGEAYAKVTCNQYTSSWEQSSSYSTVSARTICSLPWPHTQPSHMIYVVYVSFVTQQMVGIQTWSAYTLQYLVCTTKVFMLCFVTLGLGPKISSNL